MFATVLLVDDQPETVADLTRSLTGHGCAVVVAGSGRQALAQARRQPPDVVLIDLMLHDTDAFSICEELRRFPATAAVPLIVMTGLASEMTLAPDYARRADAFLVKPCDPAELIRTIEKVLRHRGPAFHSIVPFTLMPARILVVDDEPDLVDLITFNLSSRGYEVIAARTGLEALQQARRHSPDLILLDLMLDDTDGYSVCETLRSQPSTAQTPIIFVSAFSGELARLNGLTAGGNDFIRKPFSTHELLRRVASVLEAPQANAGSTAAKT